MSSFVYTVHRPVHMSVHVSVCMSVHTLVTCCYCHHMCLFLPHSFSFIEQVCPTVRPRRAVRAHTSNTFMTGLTRSITLHCSVDTIYFILTSTFTLLMYRSLGSADYCQRWDRWAWLEVVYDPGILHFPCFFCVVLETLSSLASSTMLVSSGRGSFSTSRMFQASFQPKSLWSNKGEGADVWLYLKVVYLPGSEDDRHFCSSRSHSRS